MNNLAKNWLLRDTVSFFAIFFLFIWVFKFPEFAASNTHDYGSQIAIEYWTLHKYLYGKEIIQNVGPLGFLGYPSVYTGLLDIQKLLINLFLTGCFVLLLWNNSKILPIQYRIIFLILAGIFSSVRADEMIYLLMLMLTYQLLTKLNSRIILFSTFLLALLSLAKGTLLFISIFIVIASMILAILCRRIFSFVLILGSFIFSLLAIWVSLGQPIHGFPAYAYGITWFSIGYNEAMTFFEPRKILVLGFLTLLASASVIFVNLGQSVLKFKHDTSKIGQSILFSATAMFILFATWKHGFVRADGDHAIVFFSYALVSTLWIFFSTTNIQQKSDFISISALRLKLLGFLLAISSSLIAISFVLKNNSHSWTTDWTLPVRAVKVLNPERFLTKLHIDLSKNISDMQTPITKSLAGNKPVSYFGMLPAIMVYSGLNYKSMPSTISFASWNDRVMKMDASFFRDDSHAPSYLLYNLQTVDNRLAAQDDPLAQLEILRRYNVVGFEKGNIILRRHNNVPPYSMKPISSGTNTLGSLMKVPQVSTNPVWVRIKIRESLLTHLVSFFYKPPRYFIEVFRENGRQEIFKFMPRMAVTGFMINPLITDNIDALTVWNRLGEGSGHQYITPEPSKVIGIRIICNRLKSLCGKKIDISYDRIHGFVSTQEERFAKNLPSPLPSKLNLNNKNSYQSGFLGHLDPVTYQNGTLEISGWAALKRPSIAGDGIAIKANNQYFPAMSSLFRSNQATNRFHGFASRIDIQAPKNGICSVSVIVIDSQSKTFHEGKPQSILCGIPPNLDLKNKQLYSKGFLGHVDSLEFHNGLLNISGWAAVKTSPSPGSMVIIKVNKKYFFASSHLERPDVAKYFRDSSYQYSGYSDTIQIGSAKAGECSVSIIVVDNEMKKFYEGGIHKVSCGAG